MEMNYGATTNNNTKDGGSTGESGDTPGPRDRRQTTGRDRPLTEAGSTTSETTTPASTADSDYEKTRNRLDTLCVVGYCIGLLTFVSFYHIKGFRRFPYPAIGNLQDIDPNMVVINLWEDGAILVLVTWGVRYIRKMGMILLDQWFFRAHLSETADSGGLSGRLGRSPPFENTPGTGSVKFTWWYIVPIILYHGGFGVWMGLATNYNLHYQISDIEWVIVGLVVFVLGELMVVGRTVWAARQARHSTDPVFVGSAIMPVVEIAEVISCVGYAFLTLTLPACIMAFVRFIIAILAAVAKKVHGTAF